MPLSSLSSALAMSAGQSSPEKHGTHLDVSEGAAEYAEVGRLLLVHIGDVLLQGLETLLQVGPSGGVGVGGEGNQRGRDVRQDRIIAPTCTFAQPQSDLKHPRSYMGLFIM